MMNLKTLFTSLYLLIICFTSVDGFLTLIQTMVDFPDQYPDGTCLSPMGDGGESNTSISLSVIYFELQVKT